MILYLIPTECDCGRLSLDVKSSNDKAQDETLLLLVLCNVFIFKLNAIVLKTDFPNEFNY